MELQQRILQDATRMFMRYGFKSVTMDDISREMGISKKTLYQFVENKADLIHQCLFSDLENERCEVNEILSNSDNAIEEMAKIARMVIDMLRDMTPTLLFDLKKYYRQSYDLMYRRHREHIYQTLRQNMERGIAEGLYRDNINPDILARLYVIKAMAMADPDTSAEMGYKIDEIYQQLIRYHVHGIASDEGRELIKNYDFSLHQ